MLFVPLKRFEQFLIVNFGRTRLDFLRTHSLFSKLPPQTALPTGSVISSNAWWGNWPAVAWNPFTMRVLGLWLRYGKLRNVVSDDDTVEIRSKSAVRTVTDFSVTIVIRCAKCLKNFLQLLDLDIASTLFIYFAVLYFLIGLSDSEILVQEKNYF